jgi:hypothetical protein
MSSKNYKILTNEYFEAFTNKDILSLSELYSKNIHLKDWEVDITGRNKVLDINANLFKEQFELYILDMVQSENKTINTLNIILPEHGIDIEVIDVITFNEDTFEIESIRAYK